MKKEITIIGAGLVGSLLSIYLKKRGYDVTIYERRGDMRNYLFKKERLRCNYLRTPGRYA